MLLKSHINKIDKVFQIIENGLSKMKRPYLALSWGKDSTLLLYFLIQLEPKIPCVYINSGYALPDTYKYRDQLLAKYKINYIEIKNETDYLELCKEYGLPHERSEYEQNKAVKKIKKNQADNIALAFCYDGCFWGLRAEESKKREWLIKSKTPLFCSSNGLWRCSPLAWLTTDEIFDIYNHYNIPINPIYTKKMFIKRNNIRNSGWLSTDGAKDGSIKWLKYYYPDLFSRLALHFPEIRGYV